MRIRFWGVRGTIPTPGPQTVRYGGNTSCIDILTSDQQVIIIDAGSGIRRLGQVLQQEYPDRVVGSILISHTHWDHIQACPFFAPVFARNSRFVLVGRKRVGKHLREVLAGQFLEPYLPYAYQKLPGIFLVKEVESGEKIIVGESTTIQVQDMEHPGGCLGFRIEDQGNVFVYCSDTRHDKDGLTQSVLELAQGADFLVHDAHFPEYEDAQRLPDWGHSAGWRQSVK